MSIAPFRKGSPPLVKKMNEIIAAVNALLNMTGDGLVQVVRTQLGMTLKINPDRIAPYIPKAGGGGVAIVWAIVTQMPEYNDPDKAKYLVQKAAVTSEGVWEGDGTAIEIARALNYEGYLDGVGDDSEDIRNWSPWYKVGSVVRIISKWDETSETPEARWYIDEAIRYGGPEDEASIRAHPTEGYDLAVWA